MRNGPSGAWARKGRQIHGGPGGIDLKSQQQLDRTDVQGSAMANDIKAAKVSSLWHDIPCPKLT